MTESHDKSQPAAAVDPVKVKKILIIGSIGIGNLLLFSGALRRIRAHFNQAHITIIVLKDNFKVLYENDSSVDRIIVLDAGWLKTSYRKVQFIRKLRKTHFDICITTFPANRLEYNVLARLSGARRRVAHLYETKRIRTMSFLQNLRIPVDKSLHDLDQNLNLLLPLGITPEETDRSLYLTLSDDAGKKAESFLQSHDLTDSFLIGIHPGSSVDRGMIHKRWPVQYFSQLCDWLRGRYGASILLFGGPEEISIREEIVKLSDSQPLIVTDVDFPTTASLIGQCDCFITNDSGLMHIAVAMGVRTAALFGPTDSNRTAPYGSDHHVIRLGLECSPCWSIDNLGVGWVKCIHPENICMTQMSVEKVKNILKTIIDEITHG